MEPTNDEKKRIVWNALDSCSKTEFNLMCKNHSDLGDYMINNCPEKVMKKGFQIGFGAGFTLALACLGVGYNDIKSINLSEKKIVLNN